MAPTKKEASKLALLGLCLLLSMGLVSAYTLVGNGSNYESRNRIDSAAGNASASDTVVRFISGFNVVSLFSSLNFYSRLGILNYTLYAPRNIFLVSPANESNFSDPSLVFNWTNATDPDSDPILYHLQVDTDDDFSSPEYENVSIAETGTTTTDQTSSLVNNTYFWRVRGQDSVQNGSFTGYFVFTLDSISPLIYLLGPPNGSFNDQANPLNFSALADDINLANCSLLADFSGTWEANQTVIPLHNESFDFPGVIPADGTYQWSVECADAANNQAINDTNYTIYVDYTSPVSFELISPANATTSTDNSPKPAWTQTTDVNFANYTVEFAQDTEFSPVIHRDTFTDINATTDGNFSATLANGVWYWRVVAFDQAGNNFTPSAFTLTVGAVTETIPVVVPVEGGKGGAGSRSEQQILSLEILQPKAVSLYLGEFVVVPLTVRNKGNVPLRDIELVASTPTGDLKIRFNPDLIEGLLPEADATVDFILDAAQATPGPKEVLVSGVVRQPAFTDSAKFFVNILDRETLNKSVVSDQIRFAYTLLQENEACRTIEPLLQRAEKELSQDNVDAALLSVQQALQQCKDLLAGQEPKIILPKRPSATLLFVIGEVVLFFLVFSLIYSYYRRRRFRQGY